MLIRNIADIQYIRLLLNIAGGGVDEGDAPLSLVGKRFELAERADFAVVDARHITRQSVSKWWPGKVRTAPYRPLFNAKLTLRLNSWTAAITMAVSPNALGLSGTV
ncbi:hypothetical protein BUPH_08370 (plasmid) [Paraburkholderia phenoliruptrix BR3459a]|uniref:Uncharacterized protein n=1 Tax=Paraburkholderia phenoliruptrix BR3459a TaxID=1229205 RepID=K0E3A7_9BURK|nr:hypothetical protein BUPH_08370 [Paraburkholderia phenoliruptrix BR3459a]